MLPTEYSYDSTEFRKLIEENKDFKNKVVKTMRLSMMELLASTLNKVPWRTGNLGRSITPWFFDKFPEAAQIGIGTITDYAQEQEYSEGFNHFKDIPGEEPQHNPNAQFGFFRKSLAETWTTLESRINTLLERFDKL